MTTTITTTNEIQNNPKFEQLINDLAGDFTETVKEIEASPATTKGHYDRYGALLRQLSKGKKSHATLFSLALIRAGANPSGVKYGLELFT
jgi:hypothetical protein